MPPLTAVVIGATGLIGEHVVDELLQDDAFGKVRVLVRRPYNKQHTKLEAAIVNFEDMADLKAKLGTGDCIFCCVGTTQAKVKGDKTAYYKVDYDIPMHTAKLGTEAGFRSYLLVSAISANPSSSNFYVKLKGEVERDILQFSYNSLHIFKPGLLLGSRKEFRLGELIGKGMVRLLSFVFVGGLRKYKGIDGADVAKAMVSAAKKNANGKFSYDYNGMMSLVGKS
jgi:uncharacterized protein YbjT (DUF2867 family)